VVTDVLGRLLCAGEIGKEVHFHFLSLLSLFVRGESTKFYGDFTFFYKERRPMSKEVQPPREQPAHPDLAIWLLQLEMLT